MVCTAVNCLPHVLHFCKITSLGLHHEGREGVAVWPARRRRRINKTLNLRLRAKIALYWFDALLSTLQVSFSRPISHETLSHAASFSRGPGLCPGRSSRWTWSTATEARMTPVQRLCLPCGCGLKMPSRGYGRCLVSLPCPRARQTCRSTDASTEPFRIRLGTIPQDPLILQQFDLVHCP